MVGRRISKRRRELGIKQVDLAAAMGEGVNQSMVSMIETGRNRPSFARATEIARALDVSLDWMAGLTDDPTPAARLTRELLAIGRKPPHV